jgi:hypothetical protein
MLAPSMRANCGRSRVMISEAVSVRSSRGLSAMKKRAVFADWALPLPPVPSLGW